MILSSVRQKKKPDRGDLASAFYMDFATE